MISFFIHHLRSLYYIICIEMIVDLTALFKSEMITFTQFQVLPTSTSSPSARLYATYTEDIYKSLIKIRNILNDNRQNYFSNASYSYQAFTDRQRDELNDIVRSNLDQVSSQITQLNENLKEKTSFKNPTEKQYQKEVILCLFQLFKSVSLIFKEFQIFSQSRKTKIENTIAISKQFQNGNYKIPKIQKQPNENPDDELQKQAGILFIQKVKEQQSLKQTQKQITNLNQMMVTMSNLVLQQELQTSSFLQIGQTGLIHIEKGNKNLVQANILAKKTGKIYSLVFFCMAMSLLILDYLKS